METMNVLGGDNKAEIYGHRYRIVSGLMVLIIMVKG